MNEPPLGLLCLTSLKGGLRAATTMAQVRVEAAFDRHEPRSCKCAMRLFSSGKVRRGAVHWRVGNCYRDLLLCVAVAVILNAANINDIWDRVTPSPTGRHFSHKPLICQKPLFCKGFANSTATFCCYRQRVWAVGGPTLGGNTTADVRVFLRP